MGKILTSLKKKLVNEYKFCKSDLEYKRDVVDQSREIFMKNVYEVYQPDNEDKKNREDVENSEQEVKTEDVLDEVDNVPDKIKKKVKKLYHNISKIAHPDKDREGKYTEIYSNVIKAYKEYNLFDMYEYCEMLGLNYEIDVEDMPLMNNRIAELNSEIKIIENSFIYLWNTYEGNKKMQDIVINQFIRTVGNRL